jgi:kynurenine formamidase
MADVPPIEALTPQHTLDALALVRRGQVYDLDCGRWHGMPVWEEHAPMQVLSYRTARGIAVQGDQDWLGENTVNFGWNSELVSGSMHTGTHIDALSHVTCGADHHWFGGATTDASLGDFGPMAHDASTMPPIVTRGVLLDVAGAKGGDPLPAADAITRADIERTCAAQGTELRAGDVVLVRTGYLAVWPDRDGMARHGGAGITLDAAVHIADAGAVAIGADNESLEQEPATTAGSPLPVHVELLVERGVFILELVLLEKLARDEVYEFAFVCLPLKVRGATGSMARPIAIV